MPECEPPRIRFGAPIITVMPLRVRGLGGLQGGGELGQRHALADRQIDIRQSGVVVARQRDSHLAGELNQGGAIPRVEGPPVADLAVGVGADLVHGPAAASGVGVVLLHVAELSLPRGVIHQRDQAHRVAGREGRHRVQHVRGGQLAAQMREVLGPEQVPGPGGSDGAASCSSSEPRPLPSGSLPARSESNTVVMPEAVICAS